MSCEEKGSRNEKEEIVWLIAAGPCPISTVYEAGAVEKKWTLPKPQKVTQEIAMSEQNYQKSCQALLYRKKKLKSNLRRSWLRGGRMIAAARSAAKITPKITPTADRVTPAVVRGVGDTSADALDPQRN